MVEFGKHVTIDASGCNQKRLTNHALIYDLLNQLPGRIGMTKMTLPYVVKWMDKGAKVPGISGFVMIAESHISVHTFPEKDYVFIDVFSCMNFNVKQAIKLLVDFFGAKKNTTKIVARGMDFPRSHTDYIYSPQEIELNATR
ncbi:adenosylmethionine decarboxylase [Candidatus Woesearchaeota archaeon]|nr:adenosylmethionine decarboxylase [Candidatus Woesearchaeota archaeon]